MRAVLFAIVLLAVSPLAGAEPVQVEAAPGQPVLLSCGCDASKATFRVLDEGLYEVPVVALVKPETLVPGKTLVVAPQAGLYRALAVALVRDQLVLVEFEVLVSEPVPVKKVFGVKKPRTRVEKADVPGDVAPHLQASIQVP